MYKEQLISVILPTYNRAYILERAIQSILAQTYTTFELLIIDDGSTDNTKNIVENFHDKRIHYIRHASNKGLAASRNTGIRTARGAFIANLDSDDEWLPLKLEKEFLALTQAENKVCVAYSGYKRTLANGETVYLPPAETRQKEENLLETLLDGNFISMQMTLIKKSALESAGNFDESIEALQDWELWLRLAKNCEFVYISEILTVGTVLPDSIAKNHKKRLRAREMIFKKHEDLFRTKKNTYARHAFTIGNAFGLTGDVEKARLYLKKALFTEPLNIKHASAYVLAFFSSLLFCSSFYKKVARIVTLH